MSDEVKNPVEAEVKAETKVEENDLLPFGMNFNQREVIAFLQMFQMFFSKVPKEITEKIIKLTQPPK